MKDDIIELHYIFDSLKPLVDLVISLRHLTHLK